MLEMWACFDVENFSILGGAVLTESIEQIPAAGSFFLGGSSSFTNVATLVAIPVNFCLNFASLS